MVEIANITSGQSAQTYQFFKESSYRFFYSQMCVILNESYIILSSYIHSHLLPLVTTEPAAALIVPILRMSKLRIRVVRYPAQGVELGCKPQHSDSRIYARNPLPLSMIKYWPIRCDRK